MFGRAELCRIAAAASSIDERLAGLCLPVDGSTDQLRAAGRRAEQWLALKKEPERGDLNRRRLIELFGQVRLESNRDLPKWVEVLAWICEEMTGDRPLRQPTTGESEIPFAHIHWPFVCAAIAALQQSACLGRLTLTESAWNALKLDFLSRLGAASARFLFEDFKHFRHEQRSGPRTYGLPFYDPKSRKLYFEYIATWQNGRCRRFFLLRPVAGRILATTAMLWLDNVREILARLRCDFNHICDDMIGSRTSPLISRVAVDCSDPHNGGRSVAFIEFQDGATIVYKPKSLEIESAWANFCGWLNAQHAPVRLSSARVFLRGAYGWAQYVSASGQAEGIFRRSGALLALLHALRGTDFHYENIVCGADGPIAVDLETLLTPSYELGVDDGYSTEPVRAARRLIRNSVLATHFLPLTVDSALGGIEALAGAPVERSDAGSLILHINSDAMSIEDRAGTPAEPEGDRPWNCSGNVDALLSGFAEYYSFLAARQGVILSDASPLRGFHNVTARILFASTASYGRTIRQANEYMNLHHGVDWSINFESISGRKNEAAVDHRIAAAERSALSRLDVPYFCFTASSDEVKCCNGHCFSLFSTTAERDVFERIKTLGRPDLALQKRLIRASLSKQSQVGQAPIKSDYAEGTLLSGAIRIGTILTTSSIRTNGSATWIGVVPLDHQRGMVDVIGPDLYSGVSGVAMFLAALARATGQSEFRTVAIAGIASLPDPRLITNWAELGIGGATGIGSIVYALVRAADFLNDRSILRIAGGFAGLIDEGRITDDTSLDVLGGVAGAIFGLLSLHQTGSYSDALHQAILCGKHLVNSMATDPSGHRAWRTFPASELLQTGFSHGAAGIALALSRLGSVTGIREFSDAAQEAIEFERDVFDPVRQEWPDFRPVGRESGHAAPCRWCNGAAGIGLARLGCLKQNIPDRRLENEVFQAIKITMESPELPLHHICCGTFGRLELMFSAGLIFGRPDLVHYSRVRAADLAAYAFSGGYPWPLGNDELNPGFFKGISGIGYQLLRLWSPANFPNALLWN